MSEEGELLRQRFTKMKMGMEDSAVGAASEGGLPAGLLEAHWKLAAQMQQRGGGGQHYQQQPRPQQRQQQYTGTDWAGNVRYEWYQPGSPPPPGASSWGVYMCMRCGFRGHEARICRAPNAWVGGCSICGIYRDTTCHCHTAFLRPHTNVLLGGVVVQAEQKPSPWVTDAESSPTPPLVASALQQLLNETEVEPFFPCVVAWSEPVVGEEHGTLVVVRDGTQQLHHECEVAELAVTGGSAVVQAEQQLEPSPLPREADAESSPTLPPATVQLLLHDSGVQPVVSCVVARRESAVVDGISGGFGVGTQQQQQLQQREGGQQQQSELVAVVAVATVKGTGVVEAVVIGSGTWAVWRSMLRHQKGFGRRGAPTHPFDPGKLGTVGGRYVEDEWQRDSSRSGVEGPNGSSGRSSSRTWLNGRWDGTSTFPFDPGKSQRHSPGMLCPSVAVT